MHLRYRHFLAWLLLALTLCNATAGAVLHEASHVRQAAARAGSQAPDERDAKVDDYHCLVCRLAAETVAEARLHPPALTAAALPTARPAVPADVDFTAAPPRWRYAARDPPVSAH